MVRPSAPIACVVALATSCPAQDCQPGWDPGYPDGATRPICFTLLVTGDGPDQAVYAGTAGKDCCGGRYPGILRWDGHDWAAVGGGVHSSFYGWDAEVRALSIFDDGTGPHLYIAGRFTDAGGNPARSAARLDGDSWAPLGGGLNGADGEPGQVNAIAVFDDGTGPALYAAGRFISAGGKPVANLARWNGQAWSPVGLGIGGEVFALEVYGQGDDARLYAAGSFTTADLKPASRMAAWDGSGWSDVGGGANGTVTSLRVFDGGAGPMLIAGGSFSRAGDQPTNAIASWDGAHWSPLGSGLIDGYDGKAGLVSALQVADLGDGPSLFVAGHFAKAGDAPAEGFARWDGADWAAFVPGFADPNSGGEALAMAPADFNGPVLIMGGIDGGWGPYPHLPTLWDGATFRPLGPGATGAVKALLSTESDGNPVLYAAGDFWAIGGIYANHVAALDADGWHPLGSGLDNDVTSQALFDDGHGEALYAGGIFEHAGGLPASSIARWDGQSWSPVGNPSDGPNDFVRALAVCDDGQGEALYATGYFSSMGGQPASNIARWDGAAWSPVGGGLTEVPYGSGGYCLAVYDDGNGPRLYVGGAFAKAGDTPVLNIARWNGSTWDPVGPGLKWLHHPQDQAYVLALTVFDEGDGPRLFAAGAFSRAADLLVRRIGRWDGQQWSPVGDGFDFTVHALHAFDDGGGPALFAAGDFSQAVGFGPASGVARWRNGAWTPLGDGLRGLGAGGRALAPHTVQGQPALVVGGYFKFAGNKRSDSYAVFNACPSTCPADCDPSTGSGTLDLFDFLCFINKFNAADPAADCTADGALDLFDFLCFVNAFNVGC